jgi:hypothetical protein
MRQRQNGACYARRETKAWSKPYSSLPEIIAVRDTCVLGTRFISGKHVVCIRRSEPWGKAKSPAKTGLFLARSAGLEPAIF